MIDKYGGSIDNRIRILIEILKGIKSKNLGLHVSLKINSSDFEIGGIDEEECLEICKKMANEGIDSNEISGNGTSRSRIKPMLMRLILDNVLKKLQKM